MAHVHSIYDTDLHFVIDPITRKITSESGKVTLMQTDHNSERFTFEIPRYIEGHDMSLTDVVQIHYNNIEATSPKRQNKDTYPVVDLQVSPDSDDMVIFSWLVSGNATQLVGSLNFIIRFVCYDPNNDISYQWWSDTYTQIKIASTFDNTNESVDLDDTDILESWRQQCIQAVFESEVFSTLKAQGQSYINQAKAYADKAAEISKLDTIDDVVGDMRSVINADISTPGWYRVAEYFAGTSVVGVQGAFGNSCDIFIKTSYRNTPTMVADIALESKYQYQDFHTRLSSSLTDRCVDKIRYVQDKTAVKAYLEIHYTKTVANIVSIELTRIHDSSGVYLWKTIAPVLTEETVDGLIISATHDIPKNASPVTDLDLNDLLHRYKPITSESLVLKTPILETAVSLPVGSYDYALGGSGYTGSDLPDNTYTYGTATINKRSSNSIFVMMWGHVAGDAVFPPIFNYYNGTKWSGWQTISTVAELMTVQTAMQTAVDNIQTTSRVMVNAPGWYRVAELSGSSALIPYYNCFFNLVSRNSSGVSTSATFLLNRTTNSIALNPIGVVTKDGGVFSKVRVTTEGVNNYIEVYYAPSASNACAFSVFGSLNMDSTTNVAWKALKFIPTSETVDGVTVTTTYDIPANASPVTDLNIANIKGKELLTTSILEKALTLSEGVYYYRLGGASYTGEDLPASSYAYGVAKIEKRTSSSAIVTISGLYSSNNRLSPPIFNMYNDTEWSGWLTHATTADLANYFKNTGGTVNGSITLDDGTSFTGFRNYRTQSDGSKVGMLIHAATQKNARIALDVDGVEKASLSFSETGFSITQNGVKSIIMRSSNIAEYAVPIDGSVPMTGDLWFNKFSKIGLDDSIGLRLATLNEQKDESAGRSLTLYNYGNWEDDSTALAYNVWSTAGYETYPLHHDGNSAKVVVSETPLTAEGSVRVW